jgi:hypothetical protein
VEGAVRSASCPRCRLWLHAVTCRLCGKGVVALGNGDQLCPHCGAPQRIVDMGIGEFDSIPGPLHASLSRIPVHAPEPARDATDAAPVRYRDQAHVSATLFVLALLFAALGVVASVAVGHVYAEAHATGAATAVAVGIVACLALALVAILGALAYLVDLATRVDASVHRRADDLEAAIRRWSEPA